nr:transient receptor potential cation channel subfamily M member 2-like [Biomphalaria glabrata]
MAKVFPDKQSHSESSIMDKYECDESNEGMQFIKYNIKCRECTFFKEKPEQEALVKEEDKVCYCNYLKKEHSKNALRRKSRTHLWSLSDNTEKTQTNAYGEIEFVGFGDRIGKYVRVDVDTPMDTMLDLLTKVWKMEMPNLLISVTGGAKNFNMKARLKEVFRRGLVKAAQSTGAWIVTGGTYAGVMKHVGEAVRDFGLTSQGRVTTIGIATWGCVQNKELLIRKDEDSNHPVEYSIHGEVKPKQSFLDPNHSHFILVDNGTQHQFTVEIPFRAKLEEAISKRKTGTDAITVPVCLLVLEGGPGTLETVYSALKSTTPTVVIKGSGKTADILAYAYQNTKEEEVKQEESGKNPDAEEKIKEMIKSSFGVAELEIEKCFIWVKECCARKDLLSVFELDSKNSAKDVDLAILKALLKANKNQAIDQLKLALAWNRIDVAKSEIFTDDRTWPTGMLDEIMMSAIKLSRVDFVELFLDNGLSLKNFLTKERLTALYNTIPPNCLLRTLLMKTKRKHGKGCSGEFTLVDVGHLLQDLLGDFYQPCYLTDGQSNLETFITPAQELFIWALLMNNLKLSKLFWREGKQSSTAACLFAHSVLKSLQAHTIDAKVIKKLQTAAEDYEELVNGVIKSCYSSDEERTHNILVQYMPHWGRTTCVQIALHSDNQLFISQNAFQSMLTKVWMGNMSQSNPFYMILVGIVIFPVVLFCVKFNKTNTKQKRLSSSSTKHHQIETHPTINGHSKHKSDHSLNSTKEKSRTKGHTEQIKKMIQKLKCFYCSPIVKFVMNVMTYLVFLALYSYLLVVQLTREIHWIEGVLIAWVISLFLEELREYFTYSNQSKLKTYLKNKWNYLDIVCILLFALGISLRFVPDDDFMTAARVILSINLITFFFRILQIFSINKQLGPKLVMIGKMLQDLKWFVVILLVFIVSYALASEAVLYPNSEPSWKLLYFVPRKAYWQIYGELFLDDIEDPETCTNNATEYSTYTIKRCPSEVGKYFVPILLGFYMLMTTVLLLNLLIAMFSYTFEQIQGNTDMHWCFQRFKLVLEYTERPAFPPPLILFSHFWLFIKRLKKSPPSELAKSKPFCKIFEDKEEERQLMQWEDLIADNFLDSKQKSDRNTMEGKVKATLERLDLVLSKVDELQESQNQSACQSAAAGNSDSFSNPSVVEKRVQALETQLLHTTKALDWIMTSLQEHNLASKQQKPSLQVLRK